MLLMVVEMPLEVFNNIIELAENLEVIRAHFQCA